jgi:ABC-2 type transport system ATP-binding protein
MRRELLVLDEPTNGLDPQGTREVRALIRSFADDGTTVFVSSHLLAEVEQVCTHVGVMSAGRLVAQGTLDDFRDEGEARVRVRTPDAASARDALARLLGDGSVDAEADASSEVDGAVTARLGGTAPEAVVAALVGEGVRVRGFETVHASLEQRFVELTGEGFDVVQ